MIQPPPASAAPAMPLRPPHTPSSTVTKQPAAQTRPNPKPSPALLLMEAAAGYTGQLGTEAGRGLRQSLPREMAAMVSFVRFPMSRGGGREQERLREARLLHSGGAPGRAPAGLPQPHAWKAHLTAIISHPALLLPSAAPGYTPTLPPRALLPRTPWAGRRSHFCRILFDLCLHLGSATASLKMFLSWI